MRSHFITLDEASARFGLHRKTIMALVRRGRLSGYKAKTSGRRRWFVSVSSLRTYTNPYTGILRYAPGPKLYLRRMAHDEHNDRSNEW